MKAIWRGDDEPVLGLAYGKEYEILGSAWGGSMFGVVDETGISYMYPADDFEISEGSIEDLTDVRPSTHKRGLSQNNN